MFELIAVAVALVGSAAAGLWDLRTTNVPEIIVFPMAALGILIHAAESFLSGTYAPIVISLQVGIAFTLFGILMYYLGAWGDGDSALFAAIGFLLPSAPSFAAFTIFPFPVTFFVNLFLIGAVYSIIYSIALVLRSKKLKKKVTREIRSDIKFLPIFIVPAALLVYLLPHALTVALAVLIVLLFPLYRVSRAIEKGLKKRISTKKLREGDMVAQNIPFLKISKRKIRGLTKREVRAIRRKMKYIYVREGVRYTIVFFLALSLTLFYGDVVLLLL
ncbi:MAG: prepilin peptidase [Candidatus Aenigmatarchaeota archaeon]